MKIDQLYDDKRNKMRILVIDDEENMCHMLSTILKKAGYDVDSASDGIIGLKKIEEQTYDFILCDIKMPNMDGMSFLKEAKGKTGSASIIMMSAYGTVDTAIEAMKMGAYDYISKPFKTDEVLMTLKKAEERERLKHENTILKERIKHIEKNYEFGNMIAKSASMKSVFDLAMKASKYHTTVLITGESGTGKELVARGIHYNSDRSEMPLIPINCGSIPENLLESEFFGYRKGSFTSAEKDKKGLFEEADGGTIFLDEIGELPLSLQVKLLRVLQENEIRRIGDAKTKKINVRIIAATAKNLEDEVKQGNFRQDLFYRLNVLQIKLPPLRERPEDIPILCRYFTDKYSKLFNKPIKDISAEAMSMLLKYHWPGNVRELENQIERAVILADGDLLNSEHFQIDLGSKADILRFDQIFNTYSLKDAQKIMEKELIIRALQKTGGNKTRASQLLEISHPSLLSKIKAYDI